MLAKIVISALAATALAFPASPALANEPLFDCGLNSVRQEHTTGSTYQGAAYGYALHPAGGGVSIRCVLFVNDVEVSSTPVGSGEVAATSAGPVSFEASDFDVVYLCPEITWHGSPEPDLRCWLADPPQVPPQEVFELLDLVFEAVTPLFDVVDPFILDHVDPTVCPPLSALGASGVDVPGVVEVNDQGDVFLAGAPVWDCPPYDLFPAG